MKAILRLLVLPVLAGLFFLSGFMPWSATPALAQAHCPRIFGNCSLSEEDDFFDSHGDWVSSDCYYNNC